MSVKMILSTPKRSLYPGPIFFLDWPGEKGREAHEMPHLHSN